MSSAARLHLRSDVIVEPVVDSWYAWHQLIPPVTLAMNIVERHLKIMESYVAAPQVHANAVKNPAMLGGPFINFPTPRVDAVRELIRRTRRERAPLLELHGAVRELRALLEREAEGASLEPLYAAVPAPLKGYVELVYDLESRPGYRLLENMLYRSPLHDERGQGFALSRLTGDERPFILSTPRLPDEERVHLPVPFRHAGIDRLCDSRREPVALGRLRELLGLPVGSEHALRPYFTDEPPAPRAPYEGPGVRVRYFGHACVLLETAETRVLVDPVVSYAYPTELPRFTIDDLPEVIDFVLITHAHADHVMLETLLRLRPKIKAIVVPKSAPGVLQDPSLRGALTAIGFTDVRELEHLDELPIPGGAITGLPFLGEHGDLDIASKLAYRVDLLGRSLIFAADSSNLEPELYAQLRRVLGPVEMVFLGMECDGAPASWVYGPLFAAPLSRKHDQSRRLAGSNFERARGIVEALGCRDIYVYAMGQEPWLGYVMSVQYTPRSRPIVASDELIADCRERGLRAERLYARREWVLEP